MSDNLPQVARDVLAYIAQNMTKGESICVGKTTCDQLTIEQMKELQTVGLADHGVYVCLHIVDKERYDAFTTKYPLTLDVETDMDEPMDQMETLDPMKVAPVIFVGIVDRLPSDKIAYVWRPSDDGLAGRTFVVPLDIIRDGNGAVQTIQRGDMLFVWAKAFTDEIVIASKVPPPPTQR